MLAVITDDFTGASEIAGIAHAKGFRTVIETHVAPQPDADVLVIASNMRSLNSAEAAELSSDLTRQVMALGPDLIFKKVDSVLRGNVGSELEAQMQAEAKPCALLVPANPSLRRTIVDGIYYVDDTPIAKSGFATNYTFCTATSRVTDILRERGTTEAISISPGEAFRERGVHIGNAGSAADLSSWAATMNGQTVPAGGADFFAAVIDSRPPGQQQAAAASEFRPAGRSLYVCGSNFPASQRAVLDAQPEGLCVLSMPDDIYYRKNIDAALLEQWSETVCAALKQYPAVAIIALQSQGEGSLSGNDVTKALATVASHTVVNNCVDDLMIEGGATAHALMAQLDITSLFPVESLATGVTRMLVDRYPNLSVTMKPGSYRWPSPIWKFNNKVK